MSEAETPPAETRPAYEQLTPRQRKFVDNLVAGKTQTAAAKASGYGSGKAHDKAGSRLMANPLVRQAVEQRGMQAAIDAGVTTAAVLRGIAKISHSARAKHTDRLRGYELLGRHLKLFTEKHEHTGKDGAPLPAAPAAQAPVILLTPDAAKAIAETLRAKV